MKGARYVHASMITRTCDLNKILTKEDFDYELPAGLIAQRPTASRDGCRLQVIDLGRSVEQSRERSNQASSHFQFRDLIHFLGPEDILVFNQNKVFPARLLVQKLLIQQSTKKATGSYLQSELGGQGEILLTRQVSESQFLGKIKTNGKKRKGDQFVVAESLPTNSLKLEISNIEDNGEFLIQSERPVSELFETYGLIPIPPYIRKGISDQQDRVDYQTVYGQEDSELKSVAAPTAGLHFNEELLSQLKEKGVGIYYLDLEVGLGTFAPLQDDQISQKKLHSERYRVSSEVHQAIKEARFKNRRVIAVGTTVTRALESYWLASDCLESDLSGQILETDIFLMPGDDFQVVDGLITNFHLPKSSLMMLVSCLTGREWLLSAYREAVVRKYRFYSYGDAMFLKPPRRPVRRNQAGSGLVRDW